MNNVGNSSGKFDVAVVGSGPAGLTCSIYLIRSGLDIVVVTGDMPGGQLIKTDIIENYPGFRSISGSDLMMNMLSQAESLGAKFIYQRVESLSPTGDRDFELGLSSGEFIYSRAVVIATGAEHKKLRCPGEDKFANKGVSWCATCDGPLLTSDKKVAVVGGGNTAVMEALFLSKFVSKVFLIHRRSCLRAEKIMQKKLFASDRIECIWNSEVTEILGDNSIKSVILRDAIDNSEKTLEVDGLFIAVGSVPVVSFVKDVLKTDEEGYINSSDTLTSCEGIFAAGDVVSGSLKQAIFAAGQGALAARCVADYLMGINKA
ncbi:MAG: thioredoxin-disulfide reductase [Holosporales bacterium]|jgi:thioredoxin reductase (NADPH)|nr:thioredoxin-disulfide reductase [Holosporales bacterium]